MSVKDIRYLLPVVVVLAAAVRIWLRRRRRAARQPGAGTAARTPPAPRQPRPRRLPGYGPFSSDVGLVAAREIRERLRGRIFRIGTVVMLAVVAGAIIIPTLTKSTPQPQRVGVVGSLAAPLHAVVVASAKTNGTAVKFVPEPDQKAANNAVRSGTIDLAIVNGQQIVVDQPIATNDGSGTAQLAINLGVAAAVQAAHLTPAQSAALANPKPLPVSSLQPGTAKKKVHPTSLIGVILIFVMLTQYNTWTLIGVMEEKASRVIEVLLAAVRPIQLLTGKVLGIGLVAFAQAFLIVAVALSLSAAVGSSLLHGTGPLVVVATLVWLILGYSFYCWVYAAAGSLAQRQDQVQSLAFPLSIPIIFGYIISLTAAASGSPSELIKVLAYLPPTAPFAMPVLVGFGAVSLWEFLASVVISIAGTFGVARLATTIYTRAILRTGRKVRIREVLSRSAG
ncbi:MAG TPA: ABC transporter permease [Acidimicrobiales bacterium]|nr:ABC transporter permease [Acidimicrobiales bacterium]